MPTVRHYSCSLALFAAAAILLFSGAGVQAAHAATVTATDAPSGLTLTVNGTSATVTAAPTTNLLLLRGQRITLACVRGIRSYLTYLDTSADNPQPADFALLVALAPWPPTATSATFTFTHDESAGLDLCSLSAPQAGDVYVDFPFTQDGVTAIADGKAQAQDAAVETRLAVLMQLLVGKPVKLPVSRQAALRKLRRHDPSGRYRNATHLSDITKPGTTYLLRLTHREVRLAQLSRSGTIVIAVQTKNGLDFILR